MQDYRIGQAVRVHFENLDKPEDEVYLYAGKLGQQLIVKALTGGSSHYVKPSEVSPWKK